MRKTRSFVVLSAIANLLYASPIETFTTKSISSPLIQDYCLKFRNISMEYPSLDCEFMKIIPNKALNQEIIKLKNNGYQDHFPEKSAFGLLQVLFPEFHPKENLLLEDLSSEECKICLESKVEYFYGGCGNGVCLKCHQKLEGLPCSFCRQNHQWAYPPSIYQLEKSCYPFVPVIPTPERQNLTQNIEDVYFSLVTWSNLANKDQGFFNILKNSKQKKRETHTARILQIFHILQNYSLWKLKNPLTVLRWSLIYWRKALEAIDPNQGQESFLAGKDALEFEELKKLYTEMEKSYSLILYYVHWLINTLERQCYQMFQLS